MSWLRLQQGQNKEKIWLRTCQPEIELVLEDPPRSPRSLNEHHGAEGEGAAGKGKIKSWKCLKSHSNTLCFSQVRFQIRVWNLSPSAWAKRSDRWSNQSRWDLKREARPGGKERTEHSSTWKWNFFEGKADNIRRMSCDDGASSFYRTACLSEGRGHGSGSVSRRRSWLGGSGARGLCTFRDVPVRCRRVVAVPVQRRVIILEVLIMWCCWRQYVPGADADGEW